jgi:hypothetical protein
MTAAQTPNPRGAVGTFAIPDAPTIQALVPVPAHERVMAGARAERQILLRFASNILGGPTAAAEVRNSGAERVSALRII